MRYETANAGSGAIISDAETSNPTGCIYYQ